jgi:hypothetical protein
MTYQGYPNWTGADKGLHEKGHSTGAIAPVTSGVSAASDWAADVPSA